MHIEYNGLDTCLKTSRNNETSIENALLKKCFQKKLLPPPLIQPFSLVLQVHNLKYVHFTF